MRVLDDRRGLGAPRGQQPADPVFQRFCYRRDLDRCHGSCSLLWLNAELSANHSDCGRQLVERPTLTVSEIGCREFRKTTGDGTRPLATNMDPSGDKNGHFPDEPNKCGPRATVLNRKRTKTSCYCEKIDYCG